MKVSRVTVGAWDYRKAEGSEALAFRKARACLWIRTYGDGAEKGCVNETSLDESGLGQELCSYHQVKARP